MTKLTYCKASDALVLEDGELTVDDMYQFAQMTGPIPIINTGQSDIYMVKDGKVEKVDA